MAGGKALNIESGVVLTASSGTKVKLSAAEVIDPPPFSVLAMVADGLFLQREEEEAKGKK